MTQTCNPIKGEKTTIDDCNFVANPHAHGNPPNFWDPPLVANSWLLLTGLHINSTPIDIVAS